MSQQPDTPNAPQWFQVLNQWTAGDGRLNVLEVVDEKTRIREFHGRAMVAVNKRPMSVYFVFPADVSSIADALAKFECAAKTAAEDTLLKIADQNRIVRPDGRT